MVLRSVNWKTVVFAGALLSMGLVKAQNAAPAEIPTTERGKSEWIKANPDTYRKMGGQLSGDAAAKKVVVAEAPTMEKATQPTTLVTPMPWGKPENKEAWIASHPQEYAQMQGQQAPATQPWGAPENKAAWKAAHPEQFEQLNTTGTFHWNVPTTNPNVGEKPAVQE